MRVLLAFLLIGIVGCGGGSSLPDDGTAPGASKGTPATADTPVVQAADEGTADLEKSLPKPEGPSSDVTKKQSPSSGSESGSQSDTRTDRLARYTFSSLDKDKDGKVSADEWAKSSRTRERFAKSGIKLDLPIEIDQFVSLYPGRNPAAVSSEKVTENRVETSFRGLADSTLPELAWKATTVEEHKAWHTAFRTKMLTVLGRMPDRVPLRVKWTEKQRFDKFTRHKVYIQTEKTYWCPVYYLVPHELKQRTPAIVCLHGHDGVVPYLGEGRKPGEPRPVLSRDFARFFAENGYVTALPIVRGWNETAGYQDAQDRSVKRSCQNVTMNSLLLGMSPAGLRCWDAMRVIDFLETQDEVDSKRIGLAGLSGGGTLSLYLPILDERVKLVMMAGIFSSYRNSFYAMNHCICNCLSGVMQYGEMSDVVTLHAPRPVLLINGLRDKSAPIADARQGLEKLKRVYGLLGVPERIEADFFDGPHEWSNGKTLEFLSKHFGK